MTSPSFINEQNLYEQDFYLWTQTIANQLKENNFDEIDIPNLIEEIESMGRSEKREFKNRLIVLLIHLLREGGEVTHKPPLFTLHK